MQAKAPHFLFTFLILLSISFSILAAPTGITGFVKNSINKSVRKARSASQSNASTGESEIHPATTTFDSLGKREHWQPLKHPYTIPEYTVEPAIQRAYDDSPKNMCVNRTETDTKKLDRHRCHFRPPGDDNILRLEREDRHTQSYGELGRELGSGADGIVYDVLYWKGGIGHDGHRLVAKWFSIVSHGIKEIENLSIVRELVDWGYMPKSDQTSDSESTSLWAVMHKKPGEYLDYLESYQASVLEGSWQECEDYMKVVRRAIVLGSLGYIDGSNNGVRGSPLHTDLHISNVLFEETDNGEGKLALLAYPIDWGRMKFKLDKYEIPDKKTANGIANDLRRELEQGYQVRLSKKRSRFDFSTKSQCIKPGPPNSA